MVEDVLKYKDKFHSLYTIASNGCWEWNLSLNNKGYGRISIGKRGYRILAHRFSWMLYNNSDIKDNLCVLHQCDNAKCVNPEHLHLGTILDNNREMAERNRAEKGDKRYNSKLTDMDVLWAKDMYKKGIISQHKIADMLGVAVMTVNKAINGIRWKHLTNK